MIANVKKILYFLYGAIDYNKVIVPVSSIEKNFACMTKLQYAVLFNITNFWTELHPCLHQWFAWSIVRQIQS